MNIDGKSATSGTFIIHPGEVVLIDLPNGQLQVKVEHRIDEPSRAAFEDGIVKLINFEGALATSAHFGLETPNGSAHLRFSATAVTAVDVHVVHYTAVTT